MNDIDERLASAVLNAAADAISARIAMALSGSGIPAPRASSASRKPRRAAPIARHHPGEAACPPLERLSAGHENRREPIRTRGSPLRASAAQGRDPHLRRVHDRAVARRRGPNGRHGGHPTRREPAVRTPQAGPRGRSAASAAHLHRRSPAAGSSAAPPSTTAADHASASKTRVLRTVHRPGAGRRCTAQRSRDTQSYGRAI